MGVDLPSGTVTFLFTDIEGSSRLWEQDPTEMNDALARHDEILRGVIEAEGGYIFATGGDGFAAAFSRTDDAAGCALEAQARLDEAFARSRVPVLVRMGIHTGVANERGGDYFGTSVNRAARVMQMASGRQIVVSATAHSLLDPATFASVDAGEHRLEGLTRPERLHVIHRGLASESTSIITPRRTRGMLPLTRSPFVGRRAELDATADLVRRRQVVTLTGIGGAGKTRLALEVASVLQEEFEDGASFVDLAAVSDPDDTVGATAASLDVALIQGEDPVDALAIGLAGRSALVLLDNCEHVLDQAAAIVHTVTGTAPRVHFLVTSREGLAIDGEVIRTVAPMGAGPGEDGYELFVSRVRDHDPDFVPVGRDGDLVAELCRRLDGIPLAIELAAARTRSMSTADVLAGLDDRFALLAGSRRRGLRRHQTMSEAIGWSYELLGDDEAATLRALASLVGSFDAAAACAVADVGHAGVLILESLADKSLLRVDKTITPTRYQLLETVRDFAADQLRSHDELAPVERRHKQHFVGVVAQVGDRLRGPRYLDAVHELRLARPNIANAMNLAIDEGDVNSAVSLCAPMALMSGTALERPDSGLGLAASALPAVERHPEGDRVFTVALLGAYQRADFAAAQEILARSADWERHNDRSSPELRCAQCLTTWWDSLDTAVEHGLAASLAARDGGDRIMTATALAFTSLAYWIHDRLEEAKPFAEEAVQLSQNVPSPLLEMLTTFAAANAHSFDGDQRSRDRFVECLELADLLGHRAVSGNCLLQLSLLTPEDEPRLALRLAAGAVRRHDQEMATELGVGLVVLARALLLVERAEEGAMLVAGARRRLPTYFTMPWAINRVLPVDDALRHALGNRYAAAAAAGETLDVRGLVELSQRVAAEVAASH